MADKKISALTGATTPLAGTEVLPIVQGGATVKVAVSDLTAGRAVAASSVNKVAITAPATASTLTIADGKTLTANDTVTLGTAGLTLGNSGGLTVAASKVLTVNNRLTLAGTDSTTQTFPTTSATIARTDAAQTFTGDQSLTAGNIVQATAAKGFNFSANTPLAGMTSQLLNWSEDGVFVPVATWATQGSGATTVVAATYTRIGRQVSIVLYIVATKGSASGAFKITGIPYVPLASTACSLRLDGIGAVLKVVAANVTSVGPAIIFILQAQSTAASADVTAAEMATDAYIQLSCTYHV